MKIIHKNKKALFDYEVIETYKAGIMLTGPEIKSIRQGSVNLKGAFVSIDKGAAYIRNMNVSRYKYDSSPDYDPFRTRKLLLNAREIIKIENHLKTQGVTVVALAVVLDGKYAKIEIAVARGKKKHDKREAIKGRDVKRNLQKLMKNR